MEKLAGQILTQARSLRALTGDLAHGAAREAFLARLDADIQALTTGTLRITLVPVRPAEPLLATVANALAATPGECTGALLVLAPAPVAHPAQGPVAHARLGAAAAQAGIGGVVALVDPVRVLASPVLWGHVVNNTDVVVLVGGGERDAQVDAALQVLSASVRTAIRAGDSSAGEATGVELPFREVRECPPVDEPAQWPATLAAALPGDARALALGEAVLARLGQAADLLNRHLQAELAALKFRMGEVTRQRKAADAREPGGDPREQAERLKSTLEAWTTSCQADLARTAEHGLLPFDARLLAGRLTRHDLVHREEKSAAVAKYPMLGARVFQSFLTHTYAVLPDSAAVEQIRQRMVTALTAQVTKDVESLNHRAQDLVARLRADAALYPQFAAALATVHVPALAAAAMHAPVMSIALEVEIEDKFTRIGFFKRLMEGRMVASMAFSFLTMSAGVFVLFGDPSIKRGLMKFSGVIVIMMLLYFVFSMLVKGEEEKHELEEVVERIRGRINQEVGRPLAKVQQTILKAYGEFVENVAASVMAMVDGVARARLAERTQVGEQRKAEDELLKAFLARRQQAASAGGQKLPPLTAAFERTRAELQKPAPAAVAPSVRPAMAAGTAVGAGTAGSTAGLAARPAAGDGAPAAPRPLTVTERMAQARAEIAARVAGAAASKPMSASERIALAKARPAEPGGAASTAAAAAAASPVAAASPGAATAPAVAPSPSAAPTFGSPAAGVVPLLLPDAVPAAD